MLNVNRESYVLFQTEHHKRSACCPSLAPASHHELDSPHKYVVAGCGVPVRATCAWWIGRAGLAADI